jgi:hypothetical protein
LTSDFPLLYSIRSLTHPPQVADEEIRIQIGSPGGARGGALTLRLLFRCDVKRVSAVMSRKRSSVEVAIHEAREIAPH